jgi:hypothetical protein
MIMAVGVKAYPLRPQWAVVVIEGVHVMRREPVWQETLFDTA